MCSSSSCSAFTDDSRCCFLLSFLFLISPLMDQTCPCLTESRIGTSSASRRSLPGGWRVSQRPPPATHMSLACCQIHVSALPLTASCHSALIFLSQCSHIPTYTLALATTPANLRWCETTWAANANIQKHTEDFCFCLREEKMANSHQLEALKTINYRVTRLKESKRAALCSFFLCERGWRMAELPCRSTDCEIKSHQDSASLWQTDALLWCV